MSKLMDSLVFFCTWHILTHKKSARLSTAPVAPVKRQPSRETRRSKRAHFQKPRKIKGKKIW